MQGKEFEQKHNGRWQAYEHSLRSLESGGRGVDVSKLPAMFREVCTDLALARHRMYGMELSERLNAQVIRGHKLIHRRAEGSWDKVIRFVVADFPIAVRAEWRLLLVASLSFLLPLVGMLLAGFYWPDFSWIQAVLGVGMMQQLDMMYGESDDQIHHLRSAYGSNFMMFCHYILNNIGIDFKIYAGGILACLGTLFFLIFNGVYFGAVVTYIHTACDKQAFYTFVVGHSSFELVAMLIAGMAGLRVGMGLLHPGRQTRRKSLMESGKRSLPLIFGAAGMTLLAAAIEGFWSAQPMAPPIKYTTGAVLWLLLILYLLFAGRGAGRIRRSGRATNERSSDAA